VSAARVEGCLSGPETVGVQRSGPLIVDTAPGPVGQTADLQERGRSLARSKAAQERVVVGRSFGTPYWSCGAAWLIPLATRPGRPVLVDQPHTRFVVQDENQRRTELLEEALAECLAWVESTEEYDDQFDPESAWLPRLRAIARPDGSAPLSAMYEDSFVDVEDMEAGLEQLRRMVSRARALFDQGRFEGALERARLRRRLEDANGVASRQKPPTVGPA
jgi:hypothetical protein